MVTHKIIFIYRFISTDMLLIRATLCPVRRAANGANCTLLQGKVVNRLRMTSTDESRCLKVGSISF
jgi:hypothetical protein